MILLLNLLIFLQTFELARAQCNTKDQSEISLCAIDHLLDNNLLRMNLSWHDIIGDEMTAYCNALEQFKNCTRHVIDECAKFNLKSSSFLLQAEILLGVCANINGKPLHTVYPKLIFFSELLPCLLKLSGNSNVAQVCEQDFQKNLLKLINSMEISDKTTCQ